MIRSPLLQLRIEDDQWASLRELARQRDASLIGAFQQRWVSDNLLISAARTVVTLTSQGASQ